MSLSIDAMNINTTHILYKNINIT